MPDIDTLALDINPSRSRLALVDAHAARLQRFNLAPELPPLIFEPTNEIVPPGHATPPS